jgi:hypothetical protein
MCKTYKESVTSSSINQQILHHMNWWGIFLSRNLDMLQDTNQILQKSVILFSVRGIHACVNGNDALIN